MGRGTFTFLVVAVLLLSLTTSAQLLTRTIEPIKMVEPVRIAEPLKTAEPISTYQPRISEPVKASYAYPVTKVPSILPSPVPTNPSYDKLTTTPRTQNPTRSDLIRNRLANRQIGDAQQKTLREARVDNRIGSVEKVLAVSGTVKPVSSKTRVETTLGTGNIASIQSKDPSRPIKPTTGTTTTTETTQPSEPSVGMRTPINQAAQKAQDTSGVRKGAVSGTVGADPARIGSVKNTIDDMKRTPAQTKERDQQATESTKEPSEPPNTPAVLDVIKINPEDREKLREERRAEREEKHATLIGERGDRGVAGSEVARVNSEGAPGNADGYLRPPEKEPRDQQLSPEARNELIEKRTTPKPREFGVENLKERDLRRLNIPDLENRLLKLKASEQAKAAGDTNRAKELETEADLRIERKRSVEQKTTVEEAVKQKPEMRSQLKPKKLREVAIAKEVVRITFENQSIEKSRFVLSYNATEQGSDTEMVVTIPKEIAERVDDIDFEDPPDEIIQDDPVVKWALSGVPSDKPISYAFTVDGDVADFDVLAAAAEESPGFMHKLISRMLAFFGWS